MSQQPSLSEIFLQLVNQYPELLRLLPDSTGVISPLDRAFDYRGVFRYHKNRHCELSALCDQYGSDKGEIVPTGHPYPWPAHTYADFYQRLWGHCRPFVKKVFECGLGTNNPSFPSSMGTQGKPGASLRVWRDYFPNAQIYGADIDKAVLFSEPRIHTDYLDQLNPDSIAAYWEAVRVRDFDWMIDDGLHTFAAGSCLFQHSIARLASHGIYLIEDVSQPDLLEYQRYFQDQDYQVDYVSLYRPNHTLGDNNVVVIRKFA